MAECVSEIKLDIDDLNSLLKIATRQKSKDILGLEIKKLQAELMRLQKQENKVQKPASHSTPKCYDIKLNNYAWDQSNDFVKLYVTLNNVQSLPKESVYCNYSERFMDLHVIGLENKNYQLTINNLSENIVPEKSYIKIKTDMIIVLLAKKVKKTWSCITNVEKTIKESKAVSPNISDTDDPNASIMNLMKKMYMEGDDEMKKTIAKAWTESQEKRTAGLDGLGDL